MPAEGERTTLTKQAAGPAPAQAAPTVVRSAPDTPGTVAVPGLAVELQRSATADDPLGGTTAPPEVGDALRRRQGGGRPLDPGVAERMGEAMGADFSRVRVHDDAEADRIARSVQATAFTAGTDLYFSRGTYAPGSAGGDHLLSHELAHVVQGGGGAPAGAGPVIGRADDPAEAAADAMADHAVRRLRRQASRVGGSADVEVPGAATSGAGAAGGTGALRRQAVRAGSTTIRRWNPFKKLFGGKKKKTRNAPVTVPDAPLLTPVPRVEAPQDQVVAPPLPDSGSSTPPVVSQEQVVQGQSPEVVPEQQPEVEPTPKTAKERFAEACDPQTAPPNKTVAKQRMDALRQLITTFSREEKKSIADDRATLALGRTHLGDLYYMSLLAAVDMAQKKTKSSGKKVNHHLTGAEADTFILTNIEDYPHIKPFISAAASAGKKGEGYVASVSQEDWAIVYAAQFPGDSVEEEQSTNAYVGNKVEDRPAMLHADRGTPSTAIHESMHRYSELAVLRTFGSGLNEGITEFFTRMLTTKNATPTKDGGPERDNYQSNVTFVRGMLRILGDSTNDQEVVLAEIYFEGKVEKLEARFREAWKAKDSTLSTSKLDKKWASFKTHLSGGAWAKANGLLPEA